jgi:hypothetical protein
MTFHPPTNFRDLLFPEALVEVSRLNPGYPFCFSLDPDTPDFEFRCVTYESFLNDITKAAIALRKFIPSREPGSDVRCVGILASSNYSYAVNFLACTFNLWTVSVFDIPPLVFLLCLHDLRNPASPYLHTEQSGCYSTSYLLFGFHTSFRG